MYIYVRKAARKTRRIFDGLIGNDTLKNKLFSDVISGSLSHAYIIEGKHGSGKHTIAKMTAAALCCENKESPSKSIPCGECISCRKIMENNATDVITIGREENKASIGVDAARFLRSDIRVVPNDFDYKFYIIEDADTMTPQAQNALLLSLEEPPAFVKFFLLCEDASSMLETIRSRAQILRTGPISEKNIDEYLVSHSPEALRMKKAEPLPYGELIMMSQGAIGTALELLDPKKLKVILECRAMAREFIGAVINGADSENASLLVAKFCTKREALSELLDQILLNLRDLIVISKSECAPLTFYYDRDEATSLADAISTKKLMAVYTAVSKTLDSIAMNANVRISIIKLFSDTGIL